MLAPRVILDPSRVAAQVVSGVGSLGARSIILRNEVVKGLTTAASLWAVAAIGLAVGGGLYLASTAATIIILIILAGIKPLEERYRHATPGVEVQLQAPRGVMSVGLLEQALGWRAARVRQLVVRSGDAGEPDDVTVILGKATPREIAEMIQSLGRLPSVSNVRQTHA